MSDLEARLLGTFEIGSPEWRAARMDGLGGSEVAAAVGLSPWKSRYALWCEKAGYLPAQDPGASSFRLWIGHQLEQVVVDAWTRRRPQERFARKTGMWRNLERPWQYADPDRLVVPVRRGMRPVGILEAKTADPRDAWEWGPDGGGNDDIPPYYRTQVYWYMSCLGLHSGDLAVLIGSGEFREYHVSWSDEDVTWLLDEAQRFVDSVAAEEMPDVDSSDSTYHAVRELHPDIDPDLDVQVDPDIAYRYAAAWAAKKDAEDALALERNTVASLLGSGKTARVAIGDELVPIASRRCARAGSTPSLYPAQARTLTRVLTGE